MHKPAHTHKETDRQTKTHTHTDLHSDPHRLNSNIEGSLERIRNVKESSREKANVTELEEEEPLLISLGLIVVCGADIEQGAKLWWVLLRKDSLEREKQREREERRGREYSRNVVVCRRRSTAC